MADANRRAGTDQRARGLQDPPAATALTATCRDGRRGAATIGHAPCFASVFVDRVYILASGAVAAACFAYLAALPNESITFLTLLSGVMLVGAALAAFAACTLAHMTMV